MPLSGPRGSPSFAISHSQNGFAGAIAVARRSDGSHVVLAVDGAGGAFPIAISAGGNQVNALPAFQVTARLNDPASGDIDGDGDVDVVLFGMPDGSNGAFQVIRQAPTGFLVEASTAGGPATGLADVDGEGDLDGVCGGGGGGGSPPLSNHRVSNFEIAINDGSGHFAPSFMIAGMGHAILRVPSTRTPMVMSTWLSVASWTSPSRRSPRRLSVRRLVTGSVASPNWVGRAMPTAMATSISVPRLSEPTSMMASAICDE